MSKLFDHIAREPRDYTDEQHEASLKRLAQSWHLPPTGAGYTAAAAEMYQKSALHKALGDEDPEQVELLLRNLERLTELLA